MMPLPICMPLERAAMPLLMLYAAAGY